MAHPFEEGSGRWNIQIDDSDENMKASDVSLEMMEHGESPAPGPESIQQQ